MNKLIADIGSAKISDLPDLAPNIEKNTTIGDLISKGPLSLVNLVFLIIGLIFFATLVMSGWDYLMSSGDPKKIAAAGSRFLNAFIGLAVSFFAFLIVNIITNMIGLGSFF